MMSRSRADLGLSASAIAYGGRDHPHDPGDLLRCIRYCTVNGITTDGLRKRMADRSPQWDALLPHWDELRWLLAHEIDTRKDYRAPVTCARMRHLLSETKP